MPLGLATGVGNFLGDFNDESGKIRAANEKKAGEDAQIEQRALEHLANADDPQIRAAAVTAMLTPKKAGGGSGLMKWFGQQRDHPVFDQVHTLMGGGTQPFLSEEDKAAGVASGRERGRLEGANTGYKNVTGEDLDPETFARMAQGSVGAPPARAVAAKVGTFTVPDPNDATGQKTITVAGHVDSQGNFIDSGGNYRDDVISFSPTTHAPPNPNTGGSWVTKPDPAHPGQFVKYHVDAQGKQISEAVPTVGPNAPPDVPFQTPEGLVFANPRTHQVTPQAGGPAVAKAEPPATQYNALREREKDIETRARARVAKLGPLPQDQQKLTAARDEEAKAAGFQNWADLQQQITAAQQGVAGAVPGQNAPPEPVTPPMIGAGGAAKPGTKPSAAAPKKGAKATVPGQINTAAVRTEIDKALAAIKQQD